ncbi:hypothetical protein MMC30_003872 [Trapelia coarctata]|nr:hypothetical protein [Trapelia coarctata]
MSPTPPLPQSPATQTLKTSTSDLATAVQSSLPSNQNPYKRVYVLLLSWSDAPDRDAEIEGLQDVFERLYGYETERFRIPVAKDVERFRDEKAFKKLIWRLSEVIGDLMDEDLLIFYYGGIRRGNIIRREMRKKGRGAGVSVNLSVFMRVMVEESVECHVLYLLDCAYASEVPLLGDEGDVGGVGVGK